MFFDVLMKAMAFAAENEGGRLDVFDGGVNLVAAFIQAIDPEAVLLQIFECFGGVSDADYGQVFERARGGFGDGLGESGGAAFGHDYGGSARGMRGADDGSQIVRIFHSVEYDEELRVVEDGVDAGVLVGGCKRDQSLMVSVGAGAVERVFRLKPDGDGAVAAEVDDFLDAGSAGAFGDQDAIKRASGEEGFADGVDARESLRAGRRGVLRTRLVSRKFRFRWSYRLMPDGI